MTLDERQVQLLQAGFQVLTTNIGGGGVTGPDGEPFEARDWICVVTRESDEVAKGYGLTADEARSAAFALLDREGGT